MSGSANWSRSRRSRVSPSGVRRERSITGGPRSKMVMWSTGYPSYAVVRRLTARPGQNCGCPIISPSWPRHVRSQGQIEEGLTLLDDALQIVKRTGERWFAAELYRHKGQLLQRQGQSEAAEELYRKALSIAEEQGTNLLELRAIASLPRLRRDQCRK